MKKLHISLERGQHYEVDTTEIELLNKYAVLAIEICSARCWSQSQYTIVLPNVFSLVHHETPQERQRGIRLVKKIWDAVLKAEEFVYGDGMMAADTKDALKQILKDMAWNNTQVTRELYLVCNQAAWQADHAEVRQLAWYLFSSPANTKHFLEDTFGHLADVVKRFARNFKMSKNLSLYLNDVFF